MSDATGPLHAWNAWSVEILAGPSVVPEAGIPATLGGEMIVLDHNGRSDPFVNLVYRPVGLRIVRNEAFLYVNGERSNHNFRTMHTVQDLELDWDGSIRLVGVEEREDGALVPSVWEASRLEPTREDMDKRDELFRAAGLD